MHLSPTSKLGYLSLIAFSKIYPEFAYSPSSCGRADRIMDPHSTVPGFKTWRERYTFYRASDRLPPYQHYKVQRLLVYVEGRGRISRSGPTQDLKMGSCVLQCDDPLQWIAQR